jgi:hypothetical protein
VTFDHHDLGDANRSLGRQGHDRALRQSRPLTAAVLGLPKGRERALAKQRRRASA